MVRIKLFYARDFKALLLKYGRIDAAASLIGVDGQATPPRGLDRGEGVLVGVALGGPSVASSAPARTLD
jgi:hypothetical protein